MSSVRTSPINFNDGSMEGYIQQLASDLRRRVNPDRDESRVIAENNWNIKQLRSDLSQTKHKSINEFNLIKNSIAELDNRIVNLEGIKKGNKQSKSPLFFNDSSDEEFYGGGKYNDKPININQIRKKAKKIANNPIMKQMLSDLKGITIPDNINKLLDNITEKQFFNALNLFEKKEKIMKGGAVPEPQIDTCPICFDPIGNNSIPQILWPYRCGHHNKHCIKCYHRLLSSVTTCPLCRAPMYARDSARRILGNYVVHISNIRNWSWEQWENAFDMTNMSLMMISIPIQQQYQNIYSRGGLDSGNWRDVTFLEIYFLIFVVYFLFKTYLQARQRQLERLRNSTRGERRRRIDGGKRRKKKTRKKRGGVRRETRRRGQQYHPLETLASNEMLEFFRNPETNEFVPTAMGRCRSDHTKRCLSELLNARELPNSKNDFTHEQLEIYNNIIETCKPKDIAIPSNWQSGEGQGGSRKKKTRKKRKWSLKYKKSINCKNPKGFSQKQYCKYGKKTRKRK